MSAACHSDLTTFLLDTHRSCICCRCCCQIRAELAEKELILLSKEQELLEKEQTLLVLKEEVSCTAVVLKFSNSAVAEHQKCFIDVVLVHAGAKLVATMHTLYG